MINNDDFCDFKEFLDGLNGYIFEKLELKESVTHEKILIAIKAINFLIIRYAKACGYSDHDIQKCLSESVELYTKAMDLNI